MRNNKEILRKRKERLDEIIKVIEFFEKARARKISSPSEYDKVVIGVRDSEKHLKAVKKYYTKMVNLATSHKKINLMIKITSVLHAVSFFVFTAVIVVSLVILLMYFLVKPLTLNYLLFYFFQGIVIAMVILLSIFPVMRGYTEKKLKAFYDQHSTELKSAERRGKEIVQKYIFILGKELKMYKMNPKKFRFKIYHEDYQGIEIIKKPGIFSPSYIAIAKTKK